MKNTIFPEVCLGVLRRPDRWRLICTFLRPGARAIVRNKPPASHAHPHQEVLIPLMGRGRYSVGGRVYPCTPGTVFFFDRNEAHDNGYTRETRAAIHLWIMIVEDRAFARLVKIKNGVFSPLRFECALRPDELGVDLQRAIVDARLLAEGAPELARLRLLGTFAALVARILDAAACTVSNVKRTSIQKQAIEAIQRHIDRTAGKGVSLEQLARIAGFSKFHFLRMYKRHTGLTVHQYINARRCALVATLQGEGHTHKFIGARLGFSSPSAFSRWLSKIKIALGSRL